MTRWLPWFVCLILLSGCAEKKILEKIGLITTVGYDLENDKKVKSTVVVLQINPEAAKNIDVITSKGKTSKGSRLDANLKTSKELLSGQLRVALYNEEISRKGIKPYVDTLARDPSISDLVNIGVVEGSTEEILKHDYKNIPDVGQHLFNMIEQLTKREQIPNSTLQDFRQSYYSPGIDPVVPLIKRSGNSIIVSGNAVMRNDKMVGKLSPEESFFVKLIRDDYRAGSIELTFPVKDIRGEKHNITTVIDTIKSSKKVKLMDKTQPRFDLNLKVKGRLLELQGEFDLKNPKNIQLLENAISLKLKQETQKVIAYCQERNSDVFGFGETYRSSVRFAHLTRKGWHQKYKAMKYDISVDFKLIRTGITE
ncbi:Ger(x)C family spore germination protein [Fictibacillus sp. BK138]|uniref:Ger(x)C family spore germination protein n=1 Tax=Fictibacillus sp. BK138 TaxID=2512121 RepID=UPI0010D68255|nr:Ger(x)C family spore germination protein [Fictibacillus sp. BK138]RZT15557.1 spore germination protein [Fictibacillus sp. BK138]